MHSKQQDTGGKAQTAINKTTKTTKQNKTKKMERNDKGELTSLHKVKPAENTKPKSPLLLPTHHSPKHKNTRWEHRRKMCSTFITNEQQDNFLRFNAVLVTCPNGTTKQKIKKYWLKRNHIPHHIHFHNTYTTHHTCTHAHTHTHTHTLSLSLYT